MLTLIYLPYGYSLRLCDIITTDRTRFARYTTGLFLLFLSLISSLLLGIGSRGGVDEEDPPRAILQQLLY